MQITIDTSTDTHDHIKRAIKMLQSIVGEEAMSNAPESSSAAPVPMDIFGGSSGGDIFSNAPAESSASESASAEDNAPVMNMFNVPSSSSQIQILSDETPAPNAAEAPAKSDEEPLADEELFADLFTREELERMGGKKEEKAQQSSARARVYF